MRWPRLLLLPIVAASALARGEVVFVPPLALPGPHTVACSNIAQDASKMAPGEDIQLYWEAVPRDNGAPRDPRDLLADPSNTPSITASAPADSARIFGGWAGVPIHYVLLVCYPTSAANPRSHYTLPTGRTVPHMQRGSQAPLWPDATTRYPVMLFSHGLGGSPISNSYVSVLTQLASFGYVVAAPFHGDARFAGLQLDTLADYLFVLARFDRVMQMQAVRPVALSATLDYLLAHPHWRDRIDPARVGGFGASLGGESMLLMGGAGLTTSLGQSWSQVAHDSRLKAAVGYVPYFGQPFLPAFGRDQHGLDGVTLPYLAISGTADTTAPILLAVQGVGQLEGRRALVALAGVEHGFDVASTADIFTWTITFLDAEVKGDLNARARLQRMAGVASGGDDFVVIPFNDSPTANYTGLWWSSPAGGESGWGVNLAHQADTIVATWFTYDMARRPWWLVATLERTAEGRYSGTMYETLGPPLDAAPFDAGRVRAMAAGSATFAFSDVTNGTLSYDVRGVAQSKAITRQAFGPQPECVFGAQQNLALATNYTDLWWNAPGGSEAGWGINFSHQGDTIFATWFTYDLGGSPLWLSGPLVKVAPGRFEGSLYRTAGARFDAFVASDVVATRVGSAVLTFTNGNTATLSYGLQLPGTTNTVAGTKTITREVFAAPGTACR